MKIISQKQEYEKRKHKAIFIVAFFLFFVVSTIFSVLCIKNTVYSFIKDRQTLVFVLAIGLLLALFGLALYFTIFEKEALKKSVFSLNILILFALIVLFVLQETGFFEVVKDAEHLQDWLQKAGTWMPLLYILLQYLQVIILPIPTFMSTAAGVALFGPFKTMLYSFVGVVLGSITAFYIGRKLGSKAVSWMVGEDTLKKWQEKLKGKDNFFLTVMFLLPFFPDDVLCFIAGLSSMTDKYFLCMLLIARAIGLSTTSYSLNFIPLTTWWGLLIWAGLILIVGICVFVLYKNLDSVQKWWKGLKNKQK